VSGGTKKIWHSLMCFEHGEKGFTVSYRMTSVIGIVQNIIRYYIAIGSQAVHKPRSDGKGGLDAGSLKIDLLHSMRGVCHTNLHFGAAKVQRP
jgi:hypothetical protein